MREARDPSVLLDLSLISEIEGMKEAEVLPFVWVLVCIDHSLRYSLI